jgi:hypothetical protein
MALCSHPVKDAVVAVVPPAVERGTVVVRGVLAVANVPPHHRVELCLQQVAEAVGEKEAIDDARRLLARITVDGVVFRDDHLDAGRIVAEVVIEHLADVGRIVGPGA